MHGMTNILLLHSEDLGSPKEIVWRFDVATEVFGSLMALF